MRKIAVHLPHRLHAQWLGKTKKFLNQFFPSRIYVGGRERDLRGLERGRGGPQLRQGRRQHQARREAGDS